MSLVLQHHHHLQPRPDCGRVSRLPDGAVPAHRRQGQTRRGLLLPQEARVLNCTGLTLNQKPGLANIKHGGFKKRFETLSKRCFFLNKIQSFQMFFILEFVSFWRPHEELISNLNSTSYVKMSSENESLSW